MVKRTSLNIVIHVNDETIIEPGRVPSSDTDFVSVKVGPDVSILLFTPAHAKALADAAVEAFRILKQIETDEEAAAMASAWDDSDFVDCTPDNPCQECSDTFEYPDFDDEPVYYDFEDDNDRF